MNRRTAIQRLATFFLTTASLAEAQQAGKIFRIGYLDSSTAAGSAVLVKAFLQELSKLGWIEVRERISPLSTGLRRTKAVSAWLSLRWSWSVLRSI